MVEINHEDLWLIDVSVDELIAESHCQIVSVLAREVVIQVEGS